MIRNDDRWDVRAVLLAACCIVRVCALACPRPRAQEPFYKGKRLTLLINFAAGGPTDIEGRLLAKHIAKHIDGPAAASSCRTATAPAVSSAPTMSARSARATARMFGYFTGAAWKYVMEPEKHTGRFPHLRVHRLLSPAVPSTTSAATRRPA